MIILIFKSFSILLDTVIGIVWKWWGRKELKDYYLSQSRLITAILPWLIYLDIVIIFIIYATCPTLWNILVILFGWVWGLFINLYSICEASPFTEPPLLLATGPIISTRAQKLLDKISNGGMLSRNGGRSMVNILKWVCSPLIVYWRRSWINMIVHYTKWCSHHLRQSGIKHLVLYLKASQVLLQQSVGGYVIPSTLPLKVAVSRTRGGIPRIIHSSHRTLIRARDPQVIKFWMTLLGLYRVLSFPGKIDLSTITSPGVSLTLAFLEEWKSFLSSSFWPQVRLMMGMRNLPLTPLVTAATTPKLSGWEDYEGISDFFLDWTVHPFVIRKSSPTLPPVPEDASPFISTAYASIQRAYWAFKYGVAGKFVWTSSQFYNFSRYSGKEMTLKSIFDKWKSLFPVYSGSGLDKLELGKDAFSDPIPVGKLSLKQEPAGKIRVFAMVDAFTQWWLRPLHLQLMSTFSKWYEDGTFDQLAPVKRLLKRRPKGIFSYDLSAATDRLPIDLQAALLEPALGPLGVRLWVALLVGRQYVLPKSAFNPVKQHVVYAVGQPMGALSSWAMLALTHHAIVQWSYYRVCKEIQQPYKWFTEYAVLGDDFILGDERVAKAYLSIMDSLGVKIGLAKSLVSPTRRVGEFAKRFYIPSDCSMLPIKEAIAARYNWAEMVQFARKYRMSPSQVLSFQGLGYRVKSKLCARFDQMGPRTGNLLLSLCYPGKGPMGVSCFSDWLRLVGINRRSSINELRTIQSIRDKAVNALDSSLEAYNASLYRLFSANSLQENIDSPFPDSIPEADTDSTWAEPGFDAIAHDSEVHPKLLPILRFRTINQDVGAISDRINRLHVCKINWSVPKEILKIESMISALPKVESFDIRPASQKVAPPIRVLRYMKFRTAIIRNKTKLHRKSRR